jgi:hypothetical protein
LLGPWYHVVSALCGLSPVPDIASNPQNAVMAGLDPAIHPFEKRFSED